MTSKKRQKRPPQLSFEARCAQREYNFRQKPDGSFRVTFRTKDGSLVMDRPSNREFYRDYYGRGWNEEFIKHALARDSIEKGVRVLSREVTDSGITCVVEWLSSKSKNRKN